MKNIYWAALVAATMLFTGCATTTQQAAAPAPAPVETKHACTQKHCNSKHHCKHKKCNHKCSESCEKDHKSCEQK